VCLSVYVVDFNIVLYLFVRVKWCVSADWHAPLNTHSQISVLYLKTFYAQFYNLWYSLVPWWWPIKVETCRQTIYIIKTSCAFVGVMINILWKNARSNTYQGMNKIKSMNKYLIMIVFVPTKFVSPAQRPDRINLNPHFYLLPRLRKRGNVPPLPHIHSWRSKL
jgi:hypothetical protein